MPQPIQRLSSAPIDVIGDVHGELDALLRLLGHLGYNRFGVHPEGRKLVFVGDLVDRGPDSPGVVEKVSGLYFAKQAQCILGNHELRLLNQVHKPDNSWTSQEASLRAQRQGWRAPMRVAHTLQLRAALTFFYELPIALERSDVRIIHASWDSKSLSALPELVGSWPTLFARYRRNVSQHLKAQGWTRKSIQQLKERYPLYKGPDEVPAPPFLPELCEYFMTEHNLHPLRVLTQGPQSPVPHEAPFWTGFRWQMSDRLPWWERYEEEVPVIFGHYWRSRFEGESLNEHPSLFKGLTPDAWLGPHENCFCIDYAVGLCAHERLKWADETGNAPPTDDEMWLTGARFEGSLAALRLPEEGAQTPWELIFDDGERVTLKRPGPQAHGQAHGQAH